MCTKFILLLIGPLFVFGFNESVYTPQTPAFASHLTAFEKISAINEMAASKVVFNSNRDGNQEIYLMNSDGSGVTRLTNNLAFDGDPVLSANGQKIAFVSNRDGSLEIYVMNIDGSGQTRLTNNSGSNGAPAWSTNGKIAFASDRDGNNEIYTMNADGTGQTRLTNNPANDTNPSWSRNGQLIAFESGRDGGLDIFTMNSNGTDTPTNITNDPNVLYGVPTWSTNGKQIVAHGFSFSPSFDSNIYILNANGSGVPINITDDPERDDFDFIPNWSTNGKQILFARNGEIFVMNSDGTNLMNLTQNPAFDFNPSW